VVFAAMKRNLSSQNETEKTSEGKRILSPVVSMAKEHSMCCILRDDTLAANMKNFEKEIR